MTIDNTKLVLLAAGAVLGLIIVKKTSELWMRLRELWG